jgi:hypothetical protein
MGLFFTACKYFIVFLLFAMLIGFGFWTIVKIAKVEDKVKSQPWSKYIPNPGIFSTDSGNFLDSKNNTFISGNISQ